MNTKQFQTPAAIQTYLTTSPPSVNITFTTSDGGEHVWNGSSVKWYATGLQLASIAQGSSNAAMVAVGQANSVAIQNALNLIEQTSALTGISGGTLKINSIGAPIYLSAPNNAANLVQWSQSGNTAPVCFFIPSNITIEADKDQVFLKAWSTKGYSWNTLGAQPCFATNTKSTASGYIISAASSFLRYDPAVTGATSGLIFSIASNQISWTSGIYNTVSVLATVTPPTWTAGILYIYFNGTTTLQSTTSFITATTSSNKPLAKYDGTTLFVYANTSNSVIGNSGEPTVVGFVLASSIASAVANGNFTVGDGFQIIGESNNSGYNEQEWIIDSIDTTTNTITAITTNPVGAFGGIGTNSIPMLIPANQNINIIGGIWNFNAGGMGDYTATGMINAMGFVINQCNKILFDSNSFIDGVMNTVYLCNIRNGQIRNHLNRNVAGGPQLMAPFYNITIDGIDCVCIDDPISTVNDIGANIQYIGLQLTNASTTSLVRDRYGLTIKNALLNSSRSISLYGGLGTIYGTSLENVTVRNSITTAAGNGQTWTAGVLYLDYSIVMAPNGNVYVNYGTALSTNVNNVTNAGLSTTPPTGNTITLTGSLVNGTRYTITNLGTLTGSALTTAWNAAGATGTPVLYQTFVATGNGASITGGVVASAFVDGSITWTYATTPQAHTHVGISIRNITFITTNGLNSGSQAAIIDNSGSAHIDKLLIDGVSVSNSSSFGGYLLQNATGSTIDTLHIKGVQFSKYFYGSLVYNLPTNVPNYVNNNFTGTITGTNTLTASAAQTIPAGTPIVGLGIPNNVYVYPAVVNSTAITLSSSATSSVAVVLTNQTINSSYNFITLPNTSVNAGSFVNGTTYYITNLGSLTGGALTTAWNNAGVVGTPIYGMAFIATGNGASITGGTASISTVSTVGVNGVNMPANTQAGYIGEIIIEDANIIFDLTAIASSTVSMVTYNTQQSGSLLVKNSTITTAGTLTSTPILAYSVNGGSVTFDINDCYIGANISGTGSGMSSFNITGGVVQGPLTASTNRNVITRLKGVSTDPNYPVSANGWIIQYTENLELVDCNVKCDTSGGGTSSYPAVILQGAGGANTAKSIKIKGGSYTSLDDIVVTGFVGATGGNTIRFFSLTGIVVGATITGSNISGSGTVTAINTLTKTITYSGSALSSSANGVNYTFIYTGYYLSLLYNYGGCVCENLIVQDAFIDYGTILRSNATVNQITVKNTTFGPHATYALNLQNANNYNISFSDCYSEGAFTNGSVVNTGSSTSSSTIRLNVNSCNFSTSPLGSGGTSVNIIANVVQWLGSGSYGPWGTTPNYKQIPYAASSTVAATALVAGNTYVVQTVGTTSTWPTNQIVNAGSFVTGVVYTISNLGSLTGGALTTAWDAIGYSGTPVVGGTFTASGNGSSVTGGVVTVNIALVAGSVFTASGVGTGTGTALQLLSS